MLRLDLTDLLGREEAARLMALAHRPLAGLIDLSLIVKHVRIVLPALARNSLIAVCDHHLFVSLNARVPMRHSRHSRCVTVWDKESLLMSLISGRAKHDHD